VVEPDVLLRLARQPPPDAGALADVPGVGPAVAQAYGGTILGALGVRPPGERRSAGEASPTELALEAWRAAVAREMGVPAYVVLGDRALAQLAVGASTPTNLLGPRFRAKFEGEVRRLLGLAGSS
jgi:hypothetical protein